MWRRVYGAGARGELGAVEEGLRGTGADPSPVAGAWGAVFRGQLWFATERPGPGEGPDAWEVASFVGAAPEVRAVAALAAALLVRARALAFDAEKLEEACGLLERLTDGLAAGEATGWREVARGWVRIARGRDVQPELARVTAEARQAGDADLVLESMALRALGAAADGDVDQARAHGRTVSRMARTESIPQHEYLAHLVLARVRRMSGKPHLTARIVSALLRVATPPWRPWLACELLLAQGHAPSVVAGGAPAHLADALAAARAGDRRPFDEAAEALVRASAGFAPLAADTTHLLPAIDPESSLADAPAEVAAFCVGETDEAPRGLGGVSGTDEPGAWVLARRDRPARRVLSPGLGLARTLGAAGGDAGGTRQLRTDSAIAILALAGRDGLDEGVMFRRLYGFEYEAVRHQAVRGVLYNRIRKKLGDAAELSRSDGRVRLDLATDVLVPDPRCTPPPELRILHVLAERQHAAPKDVASALGIPLRTAQEALRRLTDDGALRSEKAARGLHYILEDTTFSEPTRNARR